MEAQFFARRFRRFDQGVNGFEDVLNLLIMAGDPAFRFDLLLRQFPIAHECLPPPDKCSHDLDIHLHGAGTLEHAGKHGHPLLGEGEGMPGVLDGGGTYHKL
jgi:hypothetical protein